MNKPPVWFTIISALALLWNLLGLFAVVMNLLITPEQIAALPADQKALFEHTPQWSVYASLLAVLAGTLGCVALLLKKLIALPLLLASIIGLIVQDIALVMMLTNVDVAATPVVIMQSFVFIIALGLYVMARSAKTKDWLS